MKKKNALTPAALDALHDGFLSDLLTPGLLIEARASGKKRWRFRRLIAGTTVIASVYGGLYPATTIAEAREWGARSTNASKLVSILARPSGNGRFVTR